MSQNKCLCNYLLFSDSKLNSQCFQWVSQPCMTSSPNPEAVAYFILHCMWNIPCLLHSQPRPVSVQLFETIYGTEWVVSWVINPSQAIFTITSYEEVSVYLAETKHRYSLLHISNRNQIRTRQMVHVGRLYFYLFICDHNTSRNDETERSCKQHEKLAPLSKQLQAVATVTITPQAIWISKSLDMGQAHCPKQILLGDRACCKGM